MYNLFDDSVEMIGHGKESKVFGLLPDGFRKVSEVEAFVLAVMSVYGAAYGKTNIYDIVRTVAGYYPHISTKSTTNIILKDAVDELVAKRIIEIRNNFFVVKPDYIIGLPQRALSDKEFESAVLQAYESENVRHWSVPRHVIRFCLLTRRPSIGDAALRLMGYSGAISELFRLIEELNDLSFVDINFYSSLDSGVIPEVTPMIINHFSADDEMVSKAVDWFLAMDANAMNHSFYSLVSYLALCGTPQQIDAVVGAYRKLLRPQYHGLTAISFVADMLRGDLPLAKENAEKFRNSWCDLLDSRRKHLPQAIGGFYALLLFLSDVPAEKRLALTFLRSSIKELKELQLTTSIAYEHSVLLLNYFMNKEKAEKIQFASSFYNPVFIKCWMNIILKWENTKRGYKTIEDDLFDYNARYSLEMRHCGIYPTYDEAQSSEEIKKDLQKVLGMKALSGLIEPKPDWIEILSVFEEHANAGKSPNVESKERMVWRVDFDHHHIIPYYQKRQKAGWSKGRNIALRTLHTTVPNYASKADIKVINNIKRLDTWGGVIYELDFSKSLPHFVNHPSLFTVTDPMLPVELKEEAVELVVKEIGDSINLQLTRDLDNSLIKEGKNKYKYLTWDDGVYQTAKLMRNKGVKCLRIPIEEKDRITKALIGYSSRIGIRGDFDDPNLLKKNGKVDLVVRVQPVGDQINAAIFIKPLPKDDLLLIPGVGSEVLTHRSDKDERIQIKRSLKKEKKALVDLCSSIPSFSTMEDNEITFNDEFDALNFLSEMREKAPTIDLIWPKGESLKVAKVASMSDFNVGVKSAIDWFELSGKIAVDNDKFWSIKEMIAASAAGTKQFIKLDDHTYLKLTKALQKRLSELSSISEAKGDNLLVHRLGASALSGFVDEAGKSRTDKTWKDNLKSIEELRHFQPEVSSHLQAELRPYQLEGYNWLSRLHAWGVGACLADDMGLGKTIQVIALMLKQASEGPCLVIAPSSVCPNWQKEIARFAPVLNTVTLGLQKRKQTLKSLKAFDVLVVSYGLIQSNPDLLANKEWNIAVLDEAHAIKNAGSMRSKASMKLQAKCKIITTGTPIQNHLGELWNLFQFINPGFLGTYDAFNERFVNGNSDSEISAKRKALNRYIQPFILRRNKGDVLDDLPSKTEISLLIEQSEDEKALYEVIRQKALEDIQQSEKEGGAAHMQILAQISKLRLVSCNPRLVDVGSHLPSSKMNALEELVDNLLDAKHKALVFSQFTKHLALIREMLDGKGIRYQYLDGSSTTKQREQAILDFQSGKSDLFLISLKAGGVGLNLTAADYVIHMDPWWNPAVEDQASDRAHRIGQTRPVTVYRMVAEGTIEEKIVQLHHSKRDLADKLLADTDRSAKISSAELFELMK